MADERREELLELVKREFVGPDPIEWPGFKQENGEEILFSDPPRTRYIAGVLFPRDTLEEETSSLSEDEVNTDEISPDEDDSGGNESSDSQGFRVGKEYLEDAEELINRSNAYRQSAISITAGVYHEDRLFVEVSAGHYKTLSSTDPKTGKVVSQYPRTSIAWTNNDETLLLPTVEEGIKKIKIDETKLSFDVTIRHIRNDYSIYTFTLENTNERLAAFREEDCYFQVRFRLRSEKGFCPLPDAQRINTEDQDYLSNRLLYRNIHNYAIGHGCAAEWDESGEKVSWIETAVFPSCEVKPVLPAYIEGVSLEMGNYGPEGDLQTCISELTLMCDRYEQWISDREEEAKSLDKQYNRTADRHLANCRSCLERMRDGIQLLSDDRRVRTSFQYMNLAMLLQQLHYNLPLQKWICDEEGYFRLEPEVTTVPLPNDQSTWGEGRKRYGKWRPFQIAFILMNLRSMLESDSKDRSVVDLIWFPTGGGKTEAYLGLSAYTIFLRRLMNKDDSGTAILMRYTLRLLTAQQYERASAMICACDLIRREHEELFGRARITIGLWVGSSTTPNTMESAVKQFDELCSERTTENPFIMLKCPWCGAQMGFVQGVGGKKNPRGYYKKVGAHKRKSIIYKCSNDKCEFSDSNYSLPLYVVDDSIYESTPTLILGTVDKFAMLPFRPEAQKLFGYYDGQKLTSPDLIIQDELHLISGPLGSMVGHYETMIHELCGMNQNGKTVYPKIVASTATISRAKEQCHALYGCSPDKVFQFPPAGLSADDSFFAKEGKDKNGRKYVGVLATGSSSDATTTIRLFASLLYAAKELNVASEDKRDPYWTNVGYFNSIRELGQARTWIRADIEQHLDVIYKRRQYQKTYADDYTKRRRYIYRDEELTSRIPGDKVTASLANLNIPYQGIDYHELHADEYPIDICLATNMISVGLDVPRLGLMTVAGQPKTTSEYIQATSRVGRNADDAPGIVFVLYRPGRPRDRSHYEHFKEYHSKLYCSVEPTSVTPFSLPVRERALHAILIGMIRLESRSEYNNGRPQTPPVELLGHIEAVIRNRVSDVDPDELDDTMKKLQERLTQWKIWNPALWSPKYNKDRSFTNDVPLMYGAGDFPNEAWENRGIKTPTSMRSVDASCEAELMIREYSAKEE